MIVIAIGALVLGGAYLGLAASASVTGYAESIYAEPYPGREYAPVRWAYRLGFNAGKRRHP